MLRNSSTVRKGVLAGAAIAGVALFVMWRRSRMPKDEAAVAPPPQQPVEPREQPAQPFVEPEPEPAAAWPEPEVVEPVAEVVEPEPEAVETAEPESEAIEREPEPPLAWPEPLVHDRGPAEHGRHRASFTHPGRPRDLSPAGGPRLVSLAVPGGVARRPKPMSARATWPGVAGAGQLQPRPLRRITRQARPAALGRPR